MWCFLSLGRCLRALSSPSFFSRKGKCVSEFFGPRLRAAIWRYFICSNISFKSVFDTIWEKNAFLRQSMQSMQPQSHITGHGHGSFVGLGLPCRHGACSNARSPCSHCHRSSPMRKTHPEHWRSWEEKTGTVYFLSRDPSLSDLRRLAAGPTGPSCAV